MHFWCIYYQFETTFPCSAPASVVAKQGFDRKQKSCCQKTKIWSINKLKSREMKDEGWKMNDESWKMKDDICDCRVAFATENQDKHSL